MVLGELSVIDKPAKIAYEQYSKPVGLPNIQLKQVTKAYPTEAGNILALKRVTINLFPGEFIAIIGKSGAGKTTLVNMITGTDQITEGEVLVGDVSIHRLSETKRSLWRGLNMGVVYQFFQLMPMLSLLENVMLPMDFCGLYKSGKSEKRAMDLLRMVELENHAYKLPSAISGGQQQRAAIARALANDPPIIIADEPTGNLDSVTASNIFSIFENLVSQGKTVVIVTHDRSISQRVSRVIRIVDGEISQD